MIELVRVLVQAGASPASAARAAVVLDRGGSVAEAREALELEARPCSIGTGTILEALTGAVRPELEAGGVLEAPQVIA